ncbi:MAG TPA: glutamate racemase [Chloroflexia bacterium]|nr:glutamate racemase [Chloroflexia bacterium]
MTSTGLEVLATDSPSQSEQYPPSIERAVGPLHAEQASVPGPFSELAALCPIGAFDSGMGGLSIIAELRRTLPGEDIIFYADNANCPYGGRSDEWLRARSLEIAGLLLDQGAKAIVVACNTASAAGLEHLRAIHKVPIVGLVPALKPAVAATRTGVVGVFATQAAMRGRLLADVIERFALPAGVEVVTVVPEGFVEAVERGDLETQETAEYVARGLAPMLERGADAIVLGSTHYPFLKPIIRRIAGEHVQLIDSSEGVARQTCRVLEARHLLRKPDAPGSLTVYTSADPDDVRSLVWRLAGEEVPVLQG